MSAALVYITAKNADDAKRIGQDLVERRLAACANILPGMTSIYRWQGAIETSSEAVLVAKTRMALADALVKRVKELHDYDVPCAVVLPILKGNPDFLDWIAAETQTD